MGNREWVISRTERYQIRGFSGAGGKGRDIVAKDLQGKYYYLNFRYKVNILSTYYAWPHNYT